MGRLALLCPKRPLTARLLTARLLQVARECLADPDCLSFHFSSSSSQGSLHKVGVKCRSQASASLKAFTDSSLYEKLSEYVMEGSDRRARLGDQCSVVTVATPAPPTAVVPTNTELPDNPFDAYERLDNSAINMQGSNLLSPC